MAIGSRISGLFGTSTETVTRRTTWPWRRTDTGHEPARGNRSVAVARPLGPGTSAARSVVTPRASSVARVWGGSETVARQGVATMAVRGTDTAFTAGGFEAVGAVSRTVSASKASMASS